MIKSIEAIFDGEVFKPIESPDLHPNTRVHITIEAISTSMDQYDSFLSTARSLELEGPPDWSINLDKYLKGGE